jgi:hypothetical protein
MYSISEAGLMETITAYQLSRSSMVSGGDFNIVAKLEERMGGKPVNITAMTDFTDCIHHSGLSQLATTGSRFTWKRDRQLFYHVPDRYLCNSLWLEKFAAISVQHLSRAFSDHNPISGSFFNPKSTGASFKFLDMWCSHDTFLDTVKSSWQRYISGEPVRLFA